MPSRCNPAFACFALRDEAWHPAIGATQVAYSWRYLPEFSTTFCCGMEAPGLPSLDVIMRCLR